MKETPRAICPECDKNVRVTNDGTYYKHGAKYCTIHEELCPVSGGNVAFWQRVMAGQETP